MKTPTLEEVKAYFKDAKKVKTITCEIIDLSNHKDYDERQIHFCNNDYWICHKKTGNHILWDCDEGYAKIISYKEPQFTLTKSQLTELHNITDAKPLIEKWFEDEFKTELKVGNWYKWEYREDDVDLICIKKITYEKVYFYGFDGSNKGFIKEDWMSIDNDFTLATQKEVEQALISEAKKRGFKEGVKVDATNIGGDNVSKYFYLNHEDFYICKDYGDTTLRFGGSPIFSDGTWATIIEDTKLPTSLQTAIDEIGKEEIIKLLKQC